MSMKPKKRRKAVARKMLVSQMISITMKVSSVVPNIMLLTATPAGGIGEMVSNVHAVNKPGCSRASR